MRATVDPTIVVSTFDWNQLAKFHQHDWKINKVAKLGGDLLKTNKDRALESRRILHTFKWWSMQVRAPLDTNVREISRLCGTLSSIAVNVSPLNLVSFTILRNSFQRCQWIFA